MANDKETSNNLKTCGVCGDRALGYNFNAITCESCKAFFRRNALTTKEFRCPFNDNCEITVVKRRFCQKCRLEKCFAIGMRKEYIMTEEDKVLKRKKIEQNRAKKKYPRLSQEETGSLDYSHSPNIRHKDNSDDSSDEYNRKYHQSIITSSTNRFEHPKEPNSLPNSDSTYVESNYSPQSTTQHSDHPRKFNQYNSDDSDSFENADLSNRNFSEIRTILNPTPNIIPSSTTGDDPILSELIRSNAPCRNQNNHYVEDIRQTTSSIDVTRDVLQDVQRLPIEPNSIESILCEAIKLEFEAYTSLAPTHSNNSRELNDAERAKLNELIVAHKALLQPVDDEFTYVAENGQFKVAPTTNTNGPVLLDIINLTAIAIRRLIKMAKKINAFKNMCQEDQVALLKGGCTEMMILRSVLSYDSSKDSWKIPHSQETFSRIKVDVLKQAKGNIYQEHERFIKTFDPRWRMDENIILILCAITLFTPDRPRVIHQDVIKLEQNSYYYLLRRYLESIYQGCEAKSTFLKLIQKISELHKLNGEVIGVYLDVNPSDVEPLLIELFDLKPH